MPHIIYQNMSLEQVEQIAGSIVESLSKLVNTPMDHFTSELLETRAVSTGGRGCQPYPFITVKWFKRTEDQTEQAAEAITMAVKSVDNQDVCVYFKIIEPLNYFENGTHF